MFCAPFRPQLTNAKNGLLARNTLDLWRAYDRMVADVAEAQLSHNNIKKCDNPAHDQLGLKAWRI
jgi:hypothetical protein